jgi:hypothetical protein
MEGGGDVEVEGGVQGGGDVEVEGGGPIIGYCLPTLTVEDG